MCLLNAVVSVFRWFIGKGRIDMPTLLVDLSSPRSAVLPTWVSPPAPSPVEALPPVESEETGETTSRCPLVLRKRAFAYLMQCVWTMARRRLFDFCAGGGCVLASRYMSEPETDSWGVFAMILSVTRAWMQRNSVDSLDQQALGVITGIVSACLKFACADAEYTMSITYRGSVIGMEVQILGVLSGYQLIEWFDSVYIHAEQLQTALDADVISIVCSMPLCWHYVENAQARAERFLFELHRSSDQPEDIDTHALYKALRALPAFYFACTYDDLFLLQLPERHAPAMAFAILASGGYMATVAAQSGLVVAESREVLAAVLRAAPALPMADVFATGGRCPRDEWATHHRVQRAFDSLSSCVVCF